MRIQPGTAGTVLCLLVGGIFAALLASHIRETRDLAESRVRHDLMHRAELAAQVVGEKLDSADFSSLYSFGESCRNEGVRCTVTSLRGGVVWDSSGARAGSLVGLPELAAAVRDGSGWAIGEDSATGEDSIRCARRMGDSVVILARPRTDAALSASRSRTAAMLAGAVAAAGLLAIIIIIGKLEKSARRLRELARMEEYRREFVGNVAHELKTPVAGILGAVELLTEAPPPAEEERARIARLLARSARRLDALVGDLLSLSRIEHAEDFGGAEKKTVDASSLLENVVADWTDAARKVGMELEADGGGVSLECDPRLMAQAVGNLVGNAVAHSGGRKVRLSVRETDGRAEIKVADDGMGIPEESRGRVFERFWRGDGARSGEGNGLGLAIVKEIAGLHGGTVILECPSGGGCEFTISIPNGNQKGGKK